MRGKKTQGCISENAAGSQTLDCTDSDDVTQAGGAEHGCMAKSTEVFGARKTCALRGVLDSRLADANSDDVAQNHHQGNLRRPGEGGGSDG